MCVNPHLKIAHTPVTCVLKLLYSTQMFMTTLSIYCTNVVVLVLIHRSVNMNIETADPEPERHIFFSSIALNYFIGL